MSDKKTKIIVPEPILNATGMKCTEDVGVRVKEVMREKGIKPRCFVRLELGDDDQLNIITSQGVIMCDLGRFRPRSAYRISGSRSCPYYDEIVR